MNEHVHKRREKGLMRQVVRGAEKTGNDDLLDDVDTLEGVVVRAADSLIEVHEDTGINLYNAQPWLDLVHVVYPDWESEKRKH
jgi:hypothetical protein